MWKTTRLERKAQERKTKRERRKAEDDRKKEVRQRDLRRCRFPLCGCARHGYQLHVSHAEHKGMGGNPAGDRSLPMLMVLVCAPRHRESRHSIDMGGIRWRPLTEEWANGPIAWDVLGAAGQWIEVAREHAVQKLLPIQPWQERILHKLAQMDV
jgi:hypothetical protein